MNDDPVPESSEQARKSSVGLSQDLAVYSQDSWTTVPAPGDFNLPLDHGLVSSLNVQIFQPTSTLERSSPSSREQWSPLLDEGLSSPSAATAASGSTSRQSIPSRIPLVPLCYRCDVCGAPFSCASRLEKHASEMHDLAEYRCGNPSCGPFNSKAAMKRHVNESAKHRKPSTPVIQCRCRKAYSRSDKFSDHLKRAKPCRQLHPFSCWCGRFSTSDRQQMVEHYVKCKPEGKRGRGRPRK